MKTRIGVLTKGQLMLRNPPRVDSRVYVDCDESSVEEFSLGMCLNCGCPKRHKNSFCSARCCRAWRSRIK